MVTVYGYCLLGVIIPIFFPNVSPLSFFNLWFWRQQLQAIDLIFADVGQQKNTSTKQKDAPLLQLEYTSK